MPEAQKQRAEKPYEPTEILNAPMLQPYYQRDVTLWLTSNCLSKEETKTCLSK